MLTFPDVSFTALLPILISLVTACVATLGGLYTSRQNVAYIGLGGLVLTLISLLTLWDNSLTSFKGALLADNYAIAFSAVIVVGALLSLITSLDSARKAQLNFPEFDALLHFGITGCLIIAFAGDLVVLLIGVEIMSLSSYVLATFQTSRRAEEAGMKYFLLGSIGSAILIYGIALTFGATGHFDFVGIANAIAQQDFANNTLLVMGSLLMLAGFSFKVGMAPFHQWTPDVYAGSPTLVTLFMSIVVKTAAFAGFVRVFQVALGSSDAWQVPLQILIGLTVIIGNMAALRQNELKRMLAYSAIAHSGYLALAMLSSPSSGSNALIFYLLSYTLMNAGAFAVIGVIQKDDRGATLEDLRGLFYRRPMYAVAMGLFLASLAGLPPLGGFIGKYTLFSAAFSNGYVLITVLCIVSSMYALVYYLRPAMMMFMRNEGEMPLQLEPRPSSGVTVAFSAVGVLLLGIAPGLALGLLEGAGKLLAML